MKKVGFASVVGAVAVLVAPAALAQDRQESVAAALNIKAAQADAEIVARNAAAKAAYEAARAQYEADQAAYEAQAAAAEAARVKYEADKAAWAAAMAGPPARETMIAACMANDPKGCFF